MDLPRPISTPVGIVDDEASAVPIEQWATNVQNILRQIADARDDKSYSIFATSDYRTIRIAKFTRFDADHFLCLRTVGPNMDVHVHSHSLPDLFDNGPATVDDQTADRPAPGLSAQFPPNGTLVSHVRTFQLYLEQMVTFYEHMRTIDALCFVVEPTVVTTKSKSRTFKIEQNIFVHIVVDPLAAASIVCTIIGPSYGTGRFRELYDQRVRDWDPNIDIHQNLLRIFGLSFFPVRPTKDGASDPDAEAEPDCGICLQYHCEQQVPFVSCDNERCLVVYHTMCLRNWFRTLPDSRTFLDVTFGTCPYCREKMSTSFACLLL